MERAQASNADLRIGHDLTHFALREQIAGYVIPNDVNDGGDNVSAWIEDPQALKPGAQMPALGLSDEEIDALVEYLRTLD